MINTTLISHLLSSTKHKQKSKKDSTLKFVAKKYIKLLLAHFYSNMREKPVSSAQKGNDGSYLPVNQRLKTKFSCNLC